MKKRFVIIVLACGFITTKSFATETIDIKAKAKQQEIKVNGTKTDQDVIIYKDTTYLSIRQIAELLDKNVDYKNGIIYLETKNPDAKIDPETGIVTTTNTTDYIGEQSAKEIALADANLTDQDIKFLNIKFVVRNGRHVYQMEFYTPDEEYDYEIDAITGKILEKDNEVEGFNFEDSVEVPPQYIGEQLAKNIALEDAQIYESQAIFETLELDEDIDKFVYKVKFTVENIEYDYEIDAVTGEILEASQDEIKKK